MGMAAVAVNPTAVAASIMGTAVNGYGRDFGSFLNGAYLVPGWIGPGLWGYPDLVDEAQNGDASPDQYASYPSGPSSQDQAYPEQANRTGIPDRVSTGSPEGSREGRNRRCVLHAHPTVPRSPASPNPLPNHLQTGLRLR